MKQKLTGLKEEIEKFTITAGEFNTILTGLQGRKSAKIQKNSKPSSAFSWILICF